MDEWDLRERFATEEGEIAWDRLGEGPPVVLVHGTPWSSWTWRRIAPRLAESFSVHVFDLLGFGASDKRDGQDVSLAGHGARLAALLEHWRLDRPALIAHDIGGATALRAHLLHGREVAALALVDVVALAPWGSPFYRLVHDHETVFEQLPEAIHEGVLRAYVGTAQPDPLDPELEYALIAPWLGPAGQSAFYRQIAQGTQRDTDEFEPLLGTSACRRSSSGAKPIPGCRPRWAPSSPSGSPGAPRTAARSGPPGPGGRARRAHAAARRAPRLGVHLAGRQSL